MIDLYTATTPNGQKIHIMLEETGLEYTEHFLSLGKGEQFDPEFLAISPNKKTGRCLPTERRARIETLEWLFWQMGSFGPMLGQAHHFRAYAPERIQYGYDRYTNEAGRLYGVLDARLDGRDYVAAGEYTIADIAIFPWCRLHGRQGQDLADFANVRRWFEAIAARPAVAGDMAKLEDKADRTEWTEERWSNLFGAEQYRRR